MKIVFLGCGYLGYNLSEMLKKNHTIQVWGLDSPYSEQSSLFISKNVFEEEESPAQIDFLEEAIVIDTMTLIPSHATSEQEQEDLERLSKKYNSLFARFKKAKIASYYFLSSGGTVYGDCKTSAKETQELNPQSFYARSKVFMEEIIKKSDLDYLILRVGNPYGGFQIVNKKQGVIPVLIEKGLKKESFELWSKKDSSRDYLHIEDMANFINHLIEKKVRNKVLNVGSGIAVNMQELIETVEKETGPIDVRFAEGHQGLVHQIVLDVEELKKHTGYEIQITLEEGIKKEVQRMKEELK